MPASPLDKKIRNLKRLLETATGDKRVALERQLESAMLKKSMNKVNHKD